jgi:hypothetical protein
VGQRGAKAGGFIGPKKGRAVTGNAVFSCKCETWIAPKYSPGDASTSKSKNRSRLAPVSGWGVLPGYATAGAGFFAFGFAALG